MPSGAPEKKEAIEDGNAAADLRLGRLCLLQVCDSVFPVGAFALSNGMETFVQRDMLSSGDDFREYLKNYLEVAPYKELGQMALAARLASAPIASADFRRRLMELDSLSAALQSAREIREGSHRMCIRLIKLSEKMSPKIPSDAPVPGTESRHRHDPTMLPKDIHDTNHDAVTASSHLLQYRSLIESDECMGLHSIAMGVYSADHCNPREAALMYGYSLLSALTMCAAKAIPLSQYSGQRALHESLPDLVHAVDVAMHLDIDDLGISAAYLDIAAMQHETLYSRLYMS